MSDMAALGGITSDSSQDAPSTSGVFQNNDLSSSHKPLLTSNQIKIESCQKRRSSCRSIKRKKFDDEVVESSLIKSSRPRTLPSLHTPNLTLSPTTSEPLPPTPNPPPPSIPIIFSEKKKCPPKPSTGKRIKKPKSHSLTKEGRWKPTDDLALIVGVQQTCDLDAIFKGVKFSSRFTLQEIQERWYALLYDPSVSRPAVSAIKQLHSDVINQIQSHTLYSIKEEQLLATFPSSTLPTPEQIQDLTKKHPDIFLQQRSTRSLLSHWALMKQYQLLPDQTPQPWPQSIENSLSMSETEEMLEESEIPESIDEHSHFDLSLLDRANKREIRQLENELPKWQVMVDSITGISVPDFDGQTLAVLRGRLVRYLMRSREITLGRSTKDNTVDVDLALEGPAWKISRKQGIIKLFNGEFFIYNEGKRPIYVDSKPVLSGTKCKMNNNSVIEMVCLKFIFLINQDLISSMRPEL